MSTAVMHPIARRFVRDPAVTKPRACRNLFGRPNQEEIDHLLHTELQNGKDEDRNKYNFDFDCDTPLLEGKYEWDSCDAKDIPAFYRPVTVNSNGKRLPQRTPCLIASEATTRPVQSSTHTDSALPLGLQARLHGLSSVTSSQQQSSQQSLVQSSTRTDTTSNELVSTSSTCATEPMKLKRPVAVKCPSRRKTAGSAASSRASANQPKITDFLQKRKRRAEDDDVSGKRRRDNSTQLISTSEEEITL